MANYMDNYREMLSGGLFNDDQIFHPITGRGSNDVDVESFDTSEEIVKRDEESRRDPSYDNGVREAEEVIGHFKRYTQKHQHKYTESEMNAIRESCRNTIVHDYSENDEYHISDEERAKMDTLRDISIKLGGMKKVYNKIVPYIEAMRTYIEAWDIIEKNHNYMHSTEEFWEMVADGSIYNPRIIKPVYKGKMKYSIDLIIQYISNPEMDPCELEISQNKFDEEDDWYTSDEDMESKMLQYLSPDEAQFIIDYADNPPVLYTAITDRKYIEGYDQKQLRSKAKSGSKRERTIRASTHQMLNDIQRAYHASSSYGGYYAPSVYSVFEIDEEEKSYLDNMYYNGSWRDKAGVELYELRQDDAKMEQRIPGNGYRTYGDEFITTYRHTLEAAGINITKLMRNNNILDDHSGRNNASMTSRKESKKMEAKILERITKLNQSSKFKKLIAKTEKAANNANNE